MSVLRTSSHPETGVLLKIKSTACAELQKFSGTHPGALAGSSHRCDDVTFGTGKTMVTINQA